MVDVHGMGPLQRPGSNHRSPPLGRLGRVTEALQRASRSFSSVGGIPRGERSRRSLSLSAPLSGAPRVARGGGPIGPVLGGPLVLARSSLAWERTVQHSGSYSMLYWPFIGRRRRRLVSNMHGKCLKPTPTEATTVMLRCFPHRNAPTAAVVHGVRVVQAQIHREDAHQEDCRLSAALIGHRWTLRAVVSSR